MCMLSFGATVQQRFYFLWCNNKTAIYLLMRHVIVTIQHDKYICFGSDNQWQLGHYIYTHTHVSQSSYSSVPFFSNVRTLVGSKCLSCLSYSSFIIIYFVKL